MLKAERPLSARPPLHVYIYFLPTFCVHRGLPLGELPGGALPDDPVLRLHVGNVLRRVRPAAARPLLEHILLPPSFFLPDFCAHRGLPLGELPGGALPDAPVVLLPTGWQRVAGGCAPRLSSPSLFPSSSSPLAVLLMAFVRLLLNPSPLLFLAVLVGGSKHTHVVISLARLYWESVSFLARVALLPPSKTSPREEEEPVLGVGLYRRSNRVSSEVDR